MENIEKFTTTDELQDAKNLVSIFGRSLGYVLKEKQGIILDTNQEIELGEGITKMIIFKLDDKIHVQKFEDNINEGTLVNILVDGTE